jgi:hypothetical protein
MYRIPEIYKMEVECGIDMYSVSCIKTDDATPLPVPVEISTTNQPRLLLRRVVLDEWCRNLAATCENCSFAELWSIVKLSLLITSLSGNVMVGSIAIMSLNVVFKL